MTLRKKTLTIISVTFVVLVIVLYVATRFSMSHATERLEAQTTHRDTQRVVNAISEEQSTLDITVHDWASWDDTYAYVADGNPAYEKANLADASFIALGVNVVTFVGPNGELAFSRTIDLESKTGGPLPSNPGYYFANELLLRHLGPNQSVGGIFLYPGLSRPMLIVARPILTSQDEGPECGTLIMGRYLNDSWVQRLAQRMSYPIALYQWDDTDIPEDVASVRSSFSSDSTTTVKPLDGQSVAGYSLLYDIYGKPAVILRVEMPRDIFQQSQAGIRYAFLILVAIGVVFAAATLLLMERSVLSRLSGLTAGVAILGAKGDLSARLADSGKDEISGLAQQINGMMAGLESSQRALGEREELYRLLADNVTDAVFATDAHLRSTYVSPSFTRLTGYTLDEAKALTPEKILTPASLQSAMNAYAEVMALKGEHRDEAMSRTMELEYKRKDGCVTWVEVRAGIVHDAEGLPTGMVYGMRDIAERKKIESALKRSEEKYRDLFDNAPVGLFRLGVPGMDPRYG
ncbi:MAG: PAS domain S-box protein [Chloroflexi bacterium]|nr:PAS domain S-box protein [Chloroflexota bacterium]